MTISKSPTILEVESIPQVDLNFMNHTHFEEIEIVKKLGNLILHYQQSPDNSSDKQAISDSLQIWVDHTTIHFDRENELMQETGFPAAAIHSNEHELALNKLKSVFQEWKNHQNISLIADYIFELWPTWFNNHVSTMDMMTAKFAVMNGYTED